MVGVRRNDAERHLLLRLLKRYPGAHPKNGSRRDIKGRRFAWDRVTEDFNASRLCTREATKVELFTLWSSLKAKALKEREKLGEQDLPLAPLLAKVEAVMTPSPDRTSKRIKHRRSAANRASDSARGSSSDIWEYESDGSVKGASPGVGSAVAPASRTATPRKLGTAKRKAPSASQQEEKPLENWKKDADSGGKKKVFVATRQPPGQKSGRSSSPSPPQLEAFAPSSTAASVGVQPERGTAAAAAVPVRRPDATVTVPKGTPFVWAIGSPICRPRTTAPATTSTSAMPAPNTCRRTPSQTTFVRAPSFDTHRVYQPPDLAQTITKLENLYELLAKTQLHQSQRLVSMDQEYHALRMRLAEETSIVSTATQEADLAQLELERLRNQEYQDAKKRHLEADSRMKISFHNAAVVQREQEACRSKELNAAQVSQVKKLSELDLILHNEKMKTVEMTANKKKELFDIEIATAQMLSQMHTELHEEEIATARLRNQEAAINNRIAELKLKAMELELAHLQKSEPGSTA